MNPYVHSMRLKTGGVKLVYASNPNGDIDEVIRNGLGIPVTPVFTDPERINPAFSFVLDGTHARIYYNPRTCLADTFYDAVVKKELGALVLPVYVSVKSDQIVPGIEDLIDLRIIEGELAIRGLAPIAFERDKLPKFFFRDVVE